jgi:uncharacterized phosphosugar-binding protein
MLEENYHQLLIHRLERIEEQWPAVEAAGGLIADRVCAGGKLYVYDRMGTVTNELWGRAGGLVMVRALLAEGASGVAELAVSGKLGTKDVVLFTSYRADDLRDLEVADKVKETGTALVILCPFEPEIPSGERLLKDQGDIAIDTASGDETGAIAVPGMSLKVCPTSGITDVVAAYAVLGHFVTEMIARGKVPSVYMGIHLKGAREYNKALRARYEKLGY